MKLLFSLDAICVMLVESYKISPNLETGGILIGPKKHKNVITDVLPSSCFAQRERATYYQSPLDVNILNRHLREFQNKGLDYKGDFHKHPSGLITLTKGDLATCRQILQNPSYKINNFLISCIVTESQAENFPIYAYVASLNNQNQVTVEKADIQVLPKTCILECADCFAPSVSTNSGESHESKDIKPSNRGIKSRLRSRTVRNPRQGVSDNKLPQVSTKA